MRITPVYNWEKQFVARFLETSGDRNQFLKMNNLPYRDGGDCEVRALHIAANIGYGDAYEHLANTPSEWSKINKRLNGIVSAPQSWPSSVTLERVKGITRSKPKNALEFASENPFGQFVLGFKWGNRERACHYLALVHGIFCDTGSAPDHNSKIQAAFKVIR